MAKQLQEDLDKLLECPVCLDQIKEPKMLKCQHSFCSKPCLQNMIEEKNLRTQVRPERVVELRKFFQVKCAICRQINRYNKLSEIPVNLQIQNMLEIRQKRVKSSDDSRAMDGTYGII